jgi:Domain of unknown function (DUF6046)
MQDFIINLATREVAANLQFPLLRASFTSVQEQAFFGKKNQQFTIPQPQHWDSGLRNNYDFGDGSGLLRNDTVGLSAMLGTPIYDKLTLKYNGTNGIYTFSDEPVMEARQEKKIVSELPIGYDPTTCHFGSVKELMATEDMIFTIKGLLIDAKHERLPFELLQELYQLFKQNNVLEASSRYLQAMEVTYLVCKSFQVAPLEGYYDTYTYTLEAMSDTPFELQLL